MGGGREGGKGKGRREEETERGREGQRRVVKRDECVV